jgi:hypothetical protein
MASHDRVYIIAASTKAREPNVEFAATASSSGAGERRAPPPREAYFSDAVTPVMSGATPTIRAERERRHAVADQIVDGAGRAAGERLDEHRVERDGGGATEHAGADAPHGERGALVVVVAQLGRERGVRHRDNRVR